MQKTLKGSGLMQLLTQFPEPLIIDSYLQQFSSGVLNPIPTGFNYSKEFINWAETVHANYSRILYPTNYSPNRGQQIMQIQNFVKQAALQGKRVRGSASRHSWSNVFPDPEQYLVSFYPHPIIEGTSQTISQYSQQMTQLEDTLASLNFQHLSQIRKVGEFTNTVKQNNKQSILKKYLVKIGASVSNNQLRIWSNKNGYQYKSNTIISEISFIGGLMTCSHGSGLSTTTLPDYVHEIEFIDHQGNRQIISRSQHPDLINSASSSLGLLGLVIFLTIQMEDLQIVKMKPKTSYKDYVIPWPKDYAKKQQRLQREELKQWIAKAKPTSEDQDWTNNFNKFKQSFNNTYAECFFAPIEGMTIYQLNWDAYAPKTPENVAKIANQDLGVFIDNYPPEAMRTLSQFSFFITSKLYSNIQTQSIVNVVMKDLFTLFPQNNYSYANYPDAVHFSKGLRNVKIRDFQVEINIPALNNDGIIEPDYDLIQKVWWAGLEISEKRSDVINMVFEMRIYKGSNATLSPDMGYDYTCSIGITRSLTLNQEQQKQWADAIRQTFTAWTSIKDKNGNPIIVRPHWGKEWDAFPEVKQYILKDESLKANFRKFLGDYQAIAKLKGFNYLKNIEMFSNKVYRELLNNAIGKDGPHIE